MSELERLEEVEIASAPVSAAVPAHSSKLFEYVTGSAGCGKTYAMRQRIEESPTYGVLAATTGIAAVNLGGGVTTINSLLRYKNTEDLADAYIQGRLQARLAKIAQTHRHIIIDEVSMLGAEALDLMYDAVAKINEYETVKHPFGIVLVGDFCQLPPIKEKWAFKARCWKQFEVTRLTKMWRQSDPQFLEGLGLARRGEGAAAAAALSKTPITWTRSADLKFKGTTIMATNDKVNNFNDLSLRRIDAPEQYFSSCRRHCGRYHPSEWNAIPERLTLKVGAYVMILNNSLPFFDYVNGDCGTVVGIAPSYVDVRLKRNERIVRIEMLTRQHTQKDDPSAQEIANGADYDEALRCWVMGEITYMPLRLAYASTVHKSQGLSLDEVQLDLREHFMGSDNMVYVALSRCRTPGGLHIVGTPDLLAKRCKIAPEVISWL